MRLLSRIDDKLDFSPFESPTKPYAILSHRWLPAQQEVVHADVLKGNLDKPGFQKIDFCLSQAKADGYDSVWIDSCCIDKTDNTELGKSLNLMFEWYQKAAVCYVYLSDVLYDDWRDTFPASEWFQRGWTLQELVAPPEVRFYSSDRQYLGDTHSLAREIATITRVTKPFQDASVAERFEWSLSRTTTEAEDMSYCIIGLLGVSLIPIYGEGAEDAQDRLLEQIERKYGRPTLREVWSKITLAAQASTTQPKARRIADLLASLKFDHMNDRRATIANPYASTCVWLRDHQYYSEWNSMRGDRFLWIKGKAGAGKSTLIKFAELDHADCYRISFYFNARGILLERSVSGLYRSLLYQLLSGIPAMQQVILGRLDQERRYTGRNDWSLPSLQNALRCAALQLQNPVQCYIDALDECEDDEVQDMVFLLQDLSQHAPLYVLFASRYYPSVLIDCPDIRLEDHREHDQDINDYVNGRLHATQMKQQVISRAHGIFLWAVLVVRELNNAVRSGSSHKLQTILDTLPIGLMPLLESIVKRQDDLPRFKVAVQWLLFHQSALTTNSFCAAVLFGTGQDTVAADVLKGRFADVELSSWVTAWTRGLGEVVASPYIDKTSHVQVIHESVRNYLNDQPERLLLWPEDELVARSHETIKLSCLRAMDLPLEDLNSICKTHALWSYVVAKFWWHVEAAASNISQDNFLSTYDGASFLRISVFCTQDHMSSIWDYLINAELSLVLQAAVRLGVYRDAAGHPSLEELVRLAIIRRKDLSLAALLACGPDLESDIPLRKWWYSKPPESSPDSRSLVVRKGPPLFLAMELETNLMCWFGQSPMTKLLLNHGASPNSTDSGGQTILQWTIILTGLDLTSNEWQESFPIRPSSNDLAHFSCQHTNLHKELNFCSTELSHMLIRYGADLTARDSEGYTPLMTAALVGSVNHLALFYATDIEAVDPTGNSALMLACAAGQTSTAHGLLILGANPFTVNHDGDTAISITCTHHGFELAYGHAREITLAAAMLGDPPSLSRRRRLSQRPHDCDIDILSLLLQYGMSINAADARGRTALSITCSRQESYNCVLWLLDHGADPNLRNASGTFALQIAIEHCQLESAALLVTRGTNLRAEATGGRSLVSVVLDQLQSLDLDHAADCQIDHHESLCAKQDTMSVDGTIVEASVLASERLDQLRSRVLRRRLDDALVTVYEALQKRGHADEAYILEAMVERGLEIEIL